VATNITLSRLSFPRSRYTGVAITFHWLIAVLMLGNLALAWSFDSIGEAHVRTAVDTHKAIGLTVLGLALLRILWRAGHKPPPFAGGMHAWERGLAHVTHFGLYVLMVFMPLTGWIHDSAWKDAPTHPLTWFGLFTLPRIGFIEAMDPTRKQVVHHVVGLIHGASGYVLAALVLLHVAGALKHQFIDRAPSFSRMWPGR
jgi:cytochrome b561